jgi:hypothetical protein
VDPGAAVTLDGSASSDPTNDPLTYHWMQTGGVSVGLSSPSVVTPTFTAPLAAGPLTFTLTVTDTEGLSDVNTTVVTVNNLPPMADAGPNLTAPYRSTVTLDGSGSSDPNDGTLTCLWVQTGGTPVEFDPVFGPDECIAKFIAPEGNTKLTFTLTVTDPGGLSASDSTKVTVGPVPTANAGEDQQVVPGATVTLDGSSSSDPNGDPLTYGWLEVGTARIGFSSAVSVTTFAAPNGLFTFTLVVTNTIGLTDTDTVLINATRMHYYLPLILTGSPQARLEPDPVLTRVLAGSIMASTHQGDGVLIWPSRWICTSPRSWDDGYRQLLGFPPPWAGSGAIPDPRAG